MDYTSNEDRLCRNTPRRGYNAIVDVKKVDEAEFITLEEAKAHLRVDFPDEDIYIGKLRKVARQAIEKYTGLSLVPCEVTAILRNEKGNIELPYGPYINESLVTEDSDGDVMEVEIEGLDFPTVKTISDYIHCTYNAGYNADTLPGDLYMAILHQITHLYENRGDTSISETAKTLANLHKRGTWLI